MLHHDLFHSAGSGDSEKEKFVAGACRILFGKQFEFEYMSARLQVFGDFPPHSTISLILFHVTIDDLNLVVELNAGFPHGLIDGYPGNPKIGTLKFDFYFRTGHGRLPTRRSARFARFVNSVGKCEPVVSGK